MSDREAGRREEASHSLQEEEDDEEEEKEKEIAGSSTVCKRKRKRKRYQEVVRFARGRERDIRKQYGLQEKKKEKETGGSSTVCKRSASTFRSEPLTNEFSCRCASGSEPVRDVRPPLEREKVRNQLQCSFSSYSSAIFFFFF